MKLAVINFSGNVGKSTVARHLLAPRIPGCQFVAVESINAAAFRPTNPQRTASARAARSTARTPRIVLGASFFSCNPASIA